MFNTVQTMCFNKKYNNQIVLLPSNFVIFKHLHLFYIKTNIDPIHKWRRF